MAVSAYMSPFSVCLGIIVLLCGLYHLLPNRQHALCALLAFSQFVAPNSPLVMVQVGKRCLVSLVNFMVVKGL